MAAFLSQSNVDAIMVNTDVGEYRGKFEDLTDAIAGSVKARPTRPPPILQKDFILHPIQVISRRSFTHSLYRLIYCFFTIFLKIAQALENGASGVVVIMCVVGNDLTVLLDAGTVMGAEILVEVHTPTELEFALQCGATTFLVNSRDRKTGQIYPHQAKALASMIPINAVSMVAGGIKTIEEVRFL